MILATSVDTEFARAQRYRDHFSIFSISDTISQVLFPLRNLGMIHRQAFRDHNDCLPCFLLCNLELQLQQTMTEDADISISVDDCETTEAEIGCNP